MTTSARWLSPPHHAVRDAVSRALAEDLAPLGDLTSTLLDDTERSARFVAREAGRLAGTACVQETFRQVDPTVTVEWHLEEGAELEPGSVIATVTGSFPSILTSERTALNFLGHLSGIATLTATFVRTAAEGGSAQVWDTRKTIPGLRSLAKAAVRAGGGRNHRGNLSDWMLIKDNHLGNISIPEAIDRARDLWPGRTVHVECDTFEQFATAIQHGADAVLLDNMTPEEVTRCVEYAATQQGGPNRTLIEVSGGINLDTIAAYAGTGADMISVGALTNSAPVLDIGLDL